MTTSTTNPLAKNSESQGDLWVEVTIPLFILTAATVGLRVWWRRKIAGKIARTDVAIIWCSLIQEVLGCIAILKWGLGHHAAYIGLHKTHKALMYFYVYQIFYKILVSTTKMSFVFLYIDLFPIPKFIVTCWVLQASIVAAMIAFVAGTIFQCTPIPYFWDRTIVGGHCIDTAAFWYGHAGWNSLVDVLILLLPIPVIRSLQMVKNQKLAVLGIFGLGAFVIVASVMRMIALDPASKIAQMDMTYVISTSNAFLWTQVESCVAIICACLPTLKGPITRVLPNLFSSKGKTTREGYDLHNYNKTNSKIGWSDSNNMYARSSTKKDTDETSSQERIIGITKTIDVQVIKTDEGGRGKTTAETEIFRAGNRV